MPTLLEGDLLAREAKIAIVVARFNDFLTAKLLEAAIDTYVRHGGDASRLTVVHVPGSFELPLIAHKLASSKKYDAIVCLGCIIRGSTSHYDHVAGEAAKGIGQVGLQTGVPTIFGVITAENLEQAVDRAGAKMGNQGAKAMLGAIEMVNLLGKL
jgi:6,7-dimethyl-8-ribityllumazine synthase